MLRVIRLMTVMLCLMSCGAVVSALGQNDEGSLIVEVTNTDGQPVKNACVTFVPKSGEIVFRKADGRGRVRVKKLQPGSYRVVVKVDGYEAQKREVAVTAARPETIAFSMQPRKDR